MISVIIPTYNRNSVLEASIKSLLNQTYTDFELLLVDDGSTDDTRKTVESMNDKRIRYIYQENAGACAARNNGICHAKGDYIAFHDSDDICLPDRLEKQLNVLQLKNADMVCTHICGHMGDKTLVKPERDSSFLRDMNSLLEISTNSFFAKAEVFKDIMFDEEMPRWQDLEILIRIFSKYNIFLSDDVLVDVYLQDDSISKNPKKCIQAFKLMMRKHPEIESEKDEIYYYLLKLCARSKAELDIKDCIEDFGSIYKKRRDVRSLVWYIAAKMGMARKAFKLFCR